MTIASGRPGVAVINNALARRDFGGDNPLGKRLVDGRRPRRCSLAPPRSYEIVGVVRDVHSGGVDAPAPPAFYLASAQFPQRIHGRVRGHRWQPDCGARGRAGGESVASMRSCRHQRHDARQPTWPRRWRVPASSSRCSVAFGLTVFVLAALGIYGFMSYAVAERRVELAVRLAVGASPGRLAGLVIGEGGLLAALGVAAGLIAAAAAVAPAARHLVRRRCARSVHVRRRARGRRGCGCRRQRAGGAARQPDRSGIGAQGVISRQAANRSSVTPPAAHARSGRRRARTRPP